MKIIGWSEDRITELVALWNKELATDFPMRKELFKQNSFDDVNVADEGSFIALDVAGNVIGFIITKLWQEKIEVGMDPSRGWIQALLVASDFRKQGIGTTLFEQAEAFLKANGVTEIQLAGDPFHYFPGIPSQFGDVQKWAEKKGFEKRIDCYDLLNHLTKEYAFPSDDSVEFSILKLEEKDEFIAFFNRCFPGRWEYEAIKYFEMNGEGREFVVGRKNGKIIGFCRINDSASPTIAQNVYWSPLFDEEIGGIGPLGIDQNEQKLGYGLAITQAALVFLQQRNIKTLVIDWTILVEFYEKLDFKVWKKYGVYLRDVK